MGTDGKNEERGPDCAFVMITIRLEEGVVCVGTASIGAVLGIEASVVQAKIRGGKIASLC
jgi:hypothetical protein